MKRIAKLFLIAICIVTMVAIVGAFTACGGGDAKSGTVPKEEGAEVAETAAEVKGTAAETDKFSMIVADGWEKMDITGGFQIYKGNDIIQVTVSGMNVTEDEDKSLLENMASQYDGTALEEVNMLGVKFYKTSFTYSGVEQTIYSGVKDGEQVKIQLAGKDHMNNADIMTMFESIALK
jgi:hypothetical protein